MSKIVKNGTFGTNFFYECKSLFFDVGIPKVSYKI